MKTKRILLLLLCLCMIVPTFAACNDDTTPPTTDNGGNGGGATANPFADLSTSMTIVCPDKKQNDYNGIVVRLNNAIAEKTGASLNMTTDFVRGNNGAVDTDDYEILIGDTNRVESASVECPEDSYIIKVVDNKVVIKGDGQYYTNMGVLYFIENCIGSKDSSTLLNVASDYSYTQKLNNEAAAYIDVIEKTKKTFNLYTSTAGEEKFVPTGKTFTADAIALEVEKVFTFGAYKDSTGAETIQGVQGGCTDGKYFYFLLTNPGDGGVDDSNKDETRVVKMDPATMEIVKVGPIISVAHSNDLTYDAANKRLVVAWCSVQANKMSYINPETLAVSGVNTITKNFFAIDYDEVTKRYALSESSYAKNGYGILTYSQNFVFQKRFAGISIGHVSQGIHCDSKYIYYTMSPNNDLAGTEKINVVNVFDWDGNYVCTLTIDLPHEIEHIFWYDNCFYAGFNGTKKELYKLSFKL